MSMDTSKAWAVSVDFHTHILPAMDDGSASAEESAALLAKQGADGIGAVIATPHFYPTEQTIEEFLSRREESCTLLRSVYDPAVHPKLYLGAEVAYFTGIGKSRLVEQLTVVGTNLILIEMPFARWSKHEIDEVVALRENQGLIPLVAHIERYAKFQKRGTLEYMLARGVLFQSNADVFLNAKTAKWAMKQFERGLIAVLGSDCHDPVNRIPNLSSALSCIAHEKGMDEIEQMRFLQDFLLKGAKPIEF